MACLIKIGHIMLAVDTTAERRLVDCATRIILLTSFLCFMSREEQKPGTYSREQVYRAL